MASCTLVEKKQNYNKGNPGADVAFLKRRTFQNDPSEIRSVCDMSSLYLKALFLIKGKKQPATDLLAFWRVLQLENRNGTPDLGLVTESQHLYRSRGFYPTNEGLNWRRRVLSITSPKLSGSQETSYHPLISVGILEEPVKTKKQEPKQLWFLSLPWNCVNELNFSGVCLFFFISVFRKLRVFNYPMNT